MNCAINSSALSPRERLLLAAFAAAIVVLLATARRLTPDSRGLGTHEQLGLASCRFLHWTGRVCMTCGMTTAWSYAVRGEFRAAAAANGGGLILCILMTLAAAWALACVAAGRWLGGRPTSRVPLTMGSVWLAVTLLDWARRLLAA